MTTIAISGEMSTLSAIKEQKINQNLVIEEVEGYAVPSDETIVALKGSESVGVLRALMSLRRAQKMREIDVRSSFKQDYKNVKKQNWDTKK